MIIRLANPEILKFSQNFPLRYPNLTVELLLKFRISKGRFNKDERILGFVTNTECSKTWDIRHSYSDSYRTRIRYSGFGIRSYLFIFVIRDSGFVHVLKHSLFGIWDSFTSWNIRYSGFGIRSQNLIFDIQDSGFVIFFNLQHHFAEVSINTFNYYFTWTSKYTILLTQTFIIVLAHTTYKGRISSMGGGKEFWENG